MTTEERIIQAKMFLSKANRFPFFGYLLFLLKGRPVKELCPTIGVGQDAQWLYYNPKFIDKLGSEELKAVLIHEIMHCALQHPWRGVGKDPKLFNLAADICVNNDINTYQGMRLPKGGYIDSKYKGWFTEQIYCDLKNRMDKATDNGEKEGEIEMGITDGNGGEKRKKIKIIPTSQFSEGCRGDHTKWHEKSIGSAQAKKNQKRWQRAVNQAAEIHAKKQGNLPGELQRLVEEAAPKVDWKEVLVNYVVKNHDDFTYRQPDRRFLDSEFIMPSMEEGEKLDEVVIAVDCSGSISTDELNKFAGEVKGLLGSFKHIKAYMCSWDAQVYDWKELDDWRGEIKYFGGGGTDSRCVFDEIEKRKIDPIVVVFFSDGFAEFPNKTPEYDVIWLLSKDHQNPPFGRIIAYE